MGVAIAAVIAALGGISSAHAATLSFSPSTKTVSIGQTFTVTIVVSSADQSMNAASVDIAFPSDKLHVLSLSKTNSIMDLWVQNPTFSDAPGGGDVLAQGIVLTPGFTGATGEILNIVFQAVAQGTASVSFSSGSVLANDGNGTNILSSMARATYTIVPAAPAPVIAAPIQRPSTSAAATIAITSIPTTEDDLWYSLDSIQYQWNIPTGADGVWYTLATNSNVTPPATAAATQQTDNTYDLSSLNDGIWYFLLTTESDGVWSPAVVKILRFDRTPPEPFTITRTDGDPANTQPTFTWSTTDDLSGLSHYEMKIGDGDWFDPAILRQGSAYVLPAQSLTNSRSLVVQAIDNVGNVREESITFTVASPHSWQAWWYWFIKSVSLFELGSIVLILAIIVAMIVFVRRTLHWKKELKRELNNFMKELREEGTKIRNEEEETSVINLRPSDLRKEKKQIEEEEARLEKGVGAEIEKIKKLTDKK
jgi:hypothetical protein